MQVNDFSKGSVWKNILAQAVPLTIAQLIQLLYNIVDRMYIGRIDGTSSLALTGIGLTFPIVMLVTAFTNLFGQGGAPLCSMARGAGQKKRAEDIMGNSMVMLIITSFILTALCYVFKKPILYLFGASDVTYVYADEYLRIYIAGTVFTMLGTGMNNFVNCQGFPRIGMLTTMIGAVLNIILDPVFIFVLKMGVAGAAIATVISQAVSAVWVLSFLFGKKPELKFSKRSITLKWTYVKEIMMLGVTGFIVQATNCLVQVVCNVMLKSFGGDLYVGINTVIGSVREIFQLPIHGITSGSQPVLSFNYGAGKNERVKQGIRFTALVGFIYTIAAWLIVFAFPEFFIRLFNSDPELISGGSHALHIYFFGFFMMAFQFTGQSTFVALGRAKHAIFFSLLRKVFIVVPLTVLLPYLGLGVDGVFIAEPVSNAIGGLACFITMYMAVYKKL